MSVQSVFCISHCRNLAELIVNQLRYFDIPLTGISVLYADVEKNRQKDHHLGKLLNPGQDPAGAGTGRGIDGNARSILETGIATVFGVVAFIAAGPLAAPRHDAPAGNSPGQILELLTGWGISAGKARAYDERIRLGSILIAVHSGSPAQIMQAKFIFHKARALDIWVTSPVLQLEDRVTPHGSFLTLPGLV